MSRTMSAALAMLRAVCCRCSVYVTRTFDALLYIRVLCLRDVAYCHEAMRGRCCHAAAHTLIADVDAVRRFQR